MVRKYMVNMQSLFSERKLNLIFFIGFALITINLIAYTFNTANPYLKSDGWYFLSQFLIPWYENGFNLTDIFVLRGHGDHGHPLHRILLYLNAQIFDLDFRLEAIFGILFLILICWMLIEHFRRNVYNFTEDFTTTFFLICLILIVTSFNSTTVYTWSLVTLGYMIVFLNVVFFILLSKYLNSKKYKKLDIKLLLMGIATLLIGDDSGSLVVGIAATSLLVVALLKCSRNIATMSGLLVVIIILYQCFKLVAYHYLNDTGATDSFSNFFIFMLQNIKDLPNIFLVPFANGLMNETHLKEIFVAPEIASGILGYVVILMHIFCWIYFIKNRLYNKSYLPLFLMLYSYALIAGIIVYRVPDFGINYLHSPRYFSSYQIGFWGMILGMIMIYIHKMETTNIKQKSIFVGVFTILLLMHIWYIDKAWNHQVYIKKYNENEANRMLYLAGEQALDMPCKKDSRVRICTMNPQERDRVLNFLKENKLNVFSERIYQSSLLTH